MIGGFVRSLVLFGGGSLLLFGADLTHVTTAFGIPRGELIAMIVLQAIQEGATEIVRHGADDHRGKGLHSLFSVVRTVNGSVGNLITIQIDQVDGALPRPGIHPI